MKKTFSISICMFMASLGASAEKAFHNNSQVRLADDLEQSFESPPESARPFTWWHWVNGNVSKSGITKDLEAMKEVGIAGFILFDGSVGIPAGPVAFHSEEDQQLRAFAMKEAARLGLDAGFNNASGWSSTGGPWVQPEDSMKTLVWSETKRSADQTAPIQLAKGKRIGKKQHYMIDVDFYRDVAVLAFPTSMNTEYRIEQWEKKALHDHGAKGIHFIADLNRAPADAVVVADSIIDLTDRMRADGTLDWTPKSGIWTILRFGFISTGAQNKPASEGGKGLEIDKFSRKAVDVHWNAYINKLVESGKPALSTICIDSYEVGQQNWTDDFPQEFKKRRGYDLTPLLVCMTGRAVDSTETTERVLWDVRTTAAELMQENYFGYFKEKCHANGLKLQIEPYGSGTFDATATALIGDTVLTEFWQRENDRNLWEWTSQIVSSAMHLSGNPVVGAESFTGLRANWTPHPGFLKKWGDRAFIRGVNRYYFHTFAHQPFDDSVKPGMTFGPYGGSFHRNNTWFMKSRGWMDYISRCQFMMQAGSYQADILVLYGDGRGFNSFLDGPEPVDMNEIPGFNFDLGGMASLPDLSADEQGVIRVTHKGKKLDTGYKVLLLKRAEMMLPEHVAKLGELADQGVKIFAPKPLRTPSYSNHEQADAELQKLVEKYWDTGRIKTPDAFDGFVATLTPDCELPEKVFFTRHRIQGDDAYFISNQNDTPVTAKAIFRITGKQPELWNPVTGKRIDAPHWKKMADGRTEVTLDMEGAGSIFVVFQKPTSLEGASPVARELFQRDLSENWTVEFDPEWGPEGKIKFAKLMPWNEHVNEEIKYFSGAATYRKSFTLSKEDLIDPLELDLGKIGVLAKVTLNGKEVGTVWCEPFTIDISAAAKAGVNELQIEVVNLWVNRMIGDEFLAPYENIHPKISRGQPLPSDSLRKTFEFRFGGRNAKHWKKSDELHASGLIGPVFLQKKITAPVKREIALPWVQTTEPKEQALSEPTRILFEEFDGELSQPLNNTKLNEGDVVWQADPSWKADGSGKGKNAYIPFVPESGKVYTLTLEVNIQPASRGWLGWGFMKSNPMDKPVLPSSGAPLSWMLLRSNEAQPIQTFVGPRTAGKASHPGQPTRKTGLVLNTTQKDWTVEWLVDGTSIRGPLSLPKSSIGYIGIGSMGNINANLVSFDLSVSTVN